ncbi:MAG: DUF2490 domain-containing protein [Deltaproteobacteria bacterium]|nr:DUF2490 domain-containing protein [Kofleriaceae bacterium]
MSSERRLLVVFSTIALAIAARPALATADTQLWTKLDVKHELTRRWSLTFEQHLRFDADISRVGAIMPEPSASYRVTKWLRFGAGYRYEYERNNDDELVSRHRAYVFSRLRKDLGDVRLDHRLQLQEQWRPDANPVNRHTVRNRGEVSYTALGDLTPGASVETHHILNEEGNTIHLGKVWLTAGVEWERDRFDVSAFYRLVTGQYDASEPPGHVIGVGVGYEI